MPVVTIDAEVQARFEAAAPPGEKLEEFITQVIQEGLARLEQELAARAEAQAILNGPNRASDSAAVYRTYQEKYGLPDLSHLSGEKLVEDTERLIAAMPPEKRASLEREGWL